MCDIFVEQTKRESEWERRNANRENNEDIWNEIENRVSEGERNMACEWKKCQQKNSFIFREVENWDRNAMKFLSLHYCVRFDVVVVGGVLMNIL